MDPMGIHYLEYHPIYKAWNGHLEGVGHNTIPTGT